MKSSICLINPPTTPSESPIYFPMALVALGSYIQKQGFPVEIVDFDLELRKDSSLLNWDRFKAFALQRLSEIDAEIFGISSICNNFPTSLLLAREIRNKWPSSKIILGGPQPSAVPEKTLDFCPWLDVIVIGEGEATLLELVSKDWKSLDQIPGIAYRNKDRIVRTSPRPLIENLDDLPFPDYSLIPLKEYINPFQTPDLVEAGRGCPFLCSFCSTSLMWERRYRAKSPSRILEEMQRMVNDYSLNACLGLTHDNFTTSYGYVSEFCRYFEKNNKKGLVWSVSARPDTVNTNRLKELQAAGCRGLFFGVDTGSERMQKIIHKNLKLEHFEKVLKTAVALRMTPTTSLIAGYPEETEAELNETLSLALRSKINGSHIVQIHRLSPLAGTPVFEENRSSLFYQKLTSDMCSQGFDNSEAEGMVRANKDLFSSFYTIPTPHLKSIDVGALCIFYTAAINYLAPFLNQLLETSECTPTELFQHWMKWKGKCYPQKPIDCRLTVNTLERFAKEEYSGFQGGLFFEDLPKQQNARTI